MIGHLLRDTLNIARFTGTDDYGVSSYTVGSAVNCAVYDYQGKIIKDNYGRDVVVNKRAVMALTDAEGAAVSINEKDMIVCDGSNYEVVNFGKKKNTRGDIKHYELFLVTSKREIG